MEETKDLQNLNEEPVMQPRKKHRRPKEEDYGYIFKIRQVLNLLFMVLGVIGAVMYSGWVGNGRMEMMGAVVAVIAISMKMAECVLRYVKK